MPPTEPAPPRPQDVAATFCATLVDEWARAGVTDAVVCPGSRSTPMALALHVDERIRTHVVHDERAGAFVALGMGLASGVPAPVVTTSGTAAVELHPAVVEAAQAGVPLVAVTADRPPELAGVGAPQTIDQVRLFGSATRADHLPGVPAWEARGSWRALAARVLADARGLSGGAGAGPVHLDLAFREPLVGRPLALPEGREGGGPWVGAAPPSVVPDLGSLSSVLRSARRGVVVAGAEPGAGPSSGAGAGPGAGGDAVGSAAPRIASALGWPLLLDARVRGGLGGPGLEGATVVGAADAILRAPGRADALRPDVVLHMGAPPASRVVTEWLAGSGAVEVRVQAQGWTDPSHTAAVRLGVPVSALVQAMAAPGGDRTLAAPATEDGWAARWAAAEEAAQDAFDEVLGAEEAVTEPGTARAVLGALREGEALVVSSSMPVRDLEWYGRPRSGVRVLSNRGANGIDGVVSTAVGVALATGAPTACLVGDVALVHDSSALAALARREVDLAIVVVDNDGGGIFSFLPQAGDPGGAAFEDLFGTPHGTDLTLLAAAHGLMTIEPVEGAEVAGAVRASLDAGGPRLVRVRTDRAANVELHRRLHDAVARRLG